MLTFKLACWPLEKVSQGTETPSVFEVGPIARLKVDSKLLEDQYTFNFNVAAQRSRNSKLNGTSPNQVSTQKSKSNSMPTPKLNLVQHQKVERLLLMPF